MSLIESRAAELIEDFAFLDDWEARFQHVIDLGQANPPLQPHERTEATRVRGCASQVWLVTRRHGDHLHVRAESDAILVSGLIALIIELYDGASPQEVLAFDAKAFFERIGIGGQLTAQRANGLASMLERLRADARAAV